MDSISPLAKILAEANGIDWRSIQGSGAGGSIVEQDILNYLSRVMSGDEDPPSTPVDETPAGWTGEMPPMPAAVAASGLQALSAAGVESDITDFVAQQAQTSQAPVAPAQVPQAPVVQAPAVQTQALAEPQATRPLAEVPPISAPSPEVPMTAVYRPVEPAPVAAFMAEVPAASQVVPPAVAIPVQPEPVQPDARAVAQNFGLENPAQTAPIPPVTVTPVPEFELGSDSDAESDLEFELDDDLPEDDFQATEAPVGSLSAPLQPAPLVEPVAATFHSPVSEQPEPEPLVSEPAIQQEVQAVERPAYDPVAFDSEAEFLLADAPLVAEPSPEVAAPEALTTAPMAVPNAAVSVEPEPNSNEVVGNGIAAPEAAPVSGTTPVPVTSLVAGMAPTPETADQNQDLAPEQAAVADVAAGTTGFGLGGFLARLYGSGAAAAPETPAEAVPVVPVAAAPVESAPVTPSPAESVPEVVIGTAHTEPYMPSFAPVPEVGAPEVSSVFGAVDASPASPLLGEPLISQAPPIPDTPVAAPLVADQWRDQPATEDTDLKSVAYAAQGDQNAVVDRSDLDTATERHDPFMLGAPVADQEPDSAEPDQAAPEVAADLGQSIALPEAHEGGPDLSLTEGAHVESPEPESVQTAPVEPEPVQAEAVQPEPVAQNWTALVEPQAEHAERPADATSLAPVDVQPLRSQPSGAQAITLRLNVELGVLEDARAQLSEALYREVPLSLLVARAASRSLASLGLSTSGGVALADHAGQPLAADLSADFRASLDGLGQAAQTSPALLVLDAAELGLDELHRGECSLSVGRAGGGGSALSLRGDLDPVRGAKFLHEVAGLLNTPILLLF